MSEPEKLTVQISIIRKDPHGGITVGLYPPVEHTYETKKAAHEDYELLVKLFKRFSAIPEVS